MKFAHSALILLILFELTISQSCCDANTVTITGNSQVFVKPDSAKLSVGVTEQAKTSSLALSNLNTKINSLIAFITAAGITSKDYSTSSLSIAPKYDYSSGSGVVVAQTASQTLSVTIKSVANSQTIGKLVDQFSTVDGIQLNGLTFTQSDQNLGKKQAR